ncbi:MAG: 16S rRNA (guanine(527)-N(7))-methyltransferase RsmG [Alphaproteobacteria bacterium]|nr:16S rRNA (guanine(527)-N(7))-methyltransferase RsmG [Alphaproteobacteria bacterium]
MYSDRDFKEQFALSEASFERLQTYHKFLFKWQKAINLISNTTLQNAWLRHFADSAQIAQFIPEDIKTYVDIGCGGGFPGLVVAIMRPDLDVHLIESDERKGQFMRTVIRETGVENATVHTVRIEESYGLVTPDFVTARALASLKELFDLMMPWVEKNPALSFCFMKGERAEEEINESQDLYDFEYQKHVSLTDQKACLLQISKLKQS